MMSSFAANDQDSLSAITHTVQEFASARDWRQFHDPKNLAMALSSEAGELAAVLRWVRTEDADAFVASGRPRDQLVAEIGDVGICLLLLCARVEVNLGTVILEKVKQNTLKYPVTASRGHADPPT